VPVVRLTGTPNTELCMRGVDKLYRGERVATSRASAHNVLERNIRGQQNNKHFCCVGGVWKVSIGVFQVATNSQVLR